LKQFSLIIDENWQAYEAIRISTIFKIKYIEWCLWGQTKRKRKRSEKQ